MPEPAQHHAPDLADLRAKIDRIDADIHELLIARSEIIGNLIAVKGTQASGSAFRPVREASIMRRLVDRHRGILPLDAIEGIWRIIIATFTYVQAPYAVHADTGTDEAAMRDTARFHFGFTVPLHTYHTAEQAIAAVAASKGDLALVPAASGRNAWWTKLEGETAPKIIARLPFIERPDHPAALPVFAISHPMAEPVPPEVDLYSLRLSALPAAEALVPVAPLAQIVATAEDAALIALPHGQPVDAVTQALQKLGITVHASALVGSHMTGYTHARSHTP